MQTILSLNKREKNQFRKWVLSSLTIKHEAAQTLLLFLLSRRVLSPNNTTKPLIFQRLYPQQHYDDLRLRHTVTIAVDCLEQFIRYDKQKSRAEGNYLPLIEFYQEKKMTKYAQQFIDKQERVFTKSSIQSGTYYYTKYLLEQQIFNVKTHGSRARVTNLQDILDTHFTTFIIETLRHSVTTISHQDLYKQQYQIPILDTVLSEAKARLDIPAICLYYYAYNTLKYPDELTYFGRLKESIEQLGHHLPIEELRNAYLIAVSYCIKKFNTGFKEYNKELFQLMQYGLESKVLLEKGILSRFTYKNIITSALREEAITWARDFIEVYTSKLEERYQYTYKTYAYARYYFAYGDYEACQVELAKIEFDDVFLNLSAKLLLLKIYFELAYHDALDALIRSFKRYLERKTTIAKTTRLNYLNIIRFTERIFTIARSDKEKIKRLKTQLLETKPLTEMDWLLMQLENKSS
ncbi:MAG: hypothetical protein MK212_12775 [Saprospiraceae bacterium]|nr:hypothetical protein [Saprospiraceae bacterium]